MYGADQLLEIVIEIFLSGVVGNSRVNATNQKARSNA